MKKLLWSFDISAEQVQGYVADALAQDDDGELYPEYSKNEALFF